MDLYWKIRIENDEIQTEKKELKMGRRILFISIVIGIALSLGTAWAGPQMNPGKWEITTTTEMAGMPPQSITHTQCMTNEDSVPMSKDANQECQVTDVTTNGNTVSWKISCGGQGGGMTGNGSVTYNGDSMNGTMTMTMTSYGTNVKNTFSGRRIGPCDGSAPSTTINNTPVAPQNSGSGSDVGNVVAEDMKDVGNAAHDEAKRSAVDEVREGVRGVFNGLFK